jgi:hypothetical protein
MALQSQAAYEAGDTQSGHMFHEAAKILLMAQGLGRSGVSNPAPNAALVPGQHMHLA